MNKEKESIKVIMLKPTQWGIHHVSVGDIGTIIKMPKTYVNICGYDYHVQFDCCETAFGVFKEEVEVIDGK